MIYALALAALVAAPAWAGQTVPDAEAVSWLKRVSDAARNLPYEGVFVMQMGDSMKTIQVENHANGPSSTSRLVVLDGKKREIRCYRNESVTLVWDAKGQRLERRLGSRHFPDLLPPDVARLTDNYTLSVGGIDRVAGQECRLLELTPRDRFRWGYLLCADQLTGLPLKAAMVDQEGRMLVRYAFTSVRKGATSKAEPELPRISPTDEMRQLDESVVNVNVLPPGYQRVAATRRTLAKRGEVEHWVFSDGLSHISMFVEPAPRNVISMKGQSSRGMMNMYTRKLGDFQVTVLGDAPWPAVQSVAANLTLR
jgi:sigma-E factor negative regulatory protein RseB